MKLVLQDGMVQTIRMGANLCGMGIKEVRITHEDLKNIEDTRHARIDLFAAWLKEVVFPRLVP